MALNGSATGLPTPVGDYTLGLFVTLRLVSTALFTCKQERLISPLKTHAVIRLWSHWSVSF